MRLAWCYWIAAVVGLGAASGVFGSVKPKDCRFGMSYQGPARAGALAADKFPSGVFNATPMEQALATQLDARFTQLLPLTEATEGAVAVWHPDLGRWSTRIGQSDAPFWWASVGKLVTATIVWQLIEASELGLDETIDRWFPRFPGANLITVNQLLTHTSGVFSFNADKKLREERGYARPARLIKIAARHDLDFCPGADWNYSNTGYVMLARIVEKVTKQPLDKLIEQRIAKPLQLESVRLVKRSDPAGSVVSGFDANRTSIKQMAGSFGAAGIAGDAADMVTLLHALLTGKLVTKDTRDAAFADRYSMFGQLVSYGRGVMVLPLADPDFTTTWIGHTGGAPGAKAVLAYDTERQTYVAVVINRQAAAEAVANNLLKTLDTIVSEHSP